MATDVLAGLTTLFSGSFGILLVAIIAISLVPFIVGKFKTAFGSAR